MKIIVTGSLGHVSKPLTEQLLQKGHSVTVISSKPDRKSEIESLGATSAIGSINDVQFLADTFTGADAVYCMLPPGGFFDPTFDIMAFAEKAAGNYVTAIQASGVKRVVYLSSVGGQTDKGNGLLRFHYIAENVLRKLPSGVGITFLRPVGFYYNLLSFVNGIKTQGVMASNYGGEAVVPWVSVKDIATVAAEELLKTSTGQNVRYIASEEISCNNIATILGAAIGKPELKWIVIPGEQVRKGMISIGMNPNIAAGLTEMNDAINDGSLFGDYHHNRPSLGKTKIKDFANEFAEAFNKG